MACLSDNHKLVTTSLKGQKPTRPACLPPASGAKCCTHCRAWHPKLLFCADKETAAKMAKETMVEAASVWVVEPSKPRPVQVLA